MGSLLDAAMDRGGWEVREMEVKVGKTVSRYPL
jgi:hypothetical protein